MLLAVNDLGCVVSRRGEFTALSTARHNVKMVGWGVRKKREFFMSIVANAGSGY